MKGRKGYLPGTAWLVMLLSLLITGCATSRGILDVRIDESRNPESGRAVKIARVTDSRLFEESPRSPSIPSLKGREIGDKSITSRAIARKRNGYGKAIGDILLPEGRTVENLVREALVRSFRETGYRVIDDKAELSDNAVQIEADIEQFWAWVTPGFWAISMEFEAKVKIKGDVTSFREGETVRGYIELHSQAPGTRAWMNTINKGIDIFIEEVKKRITKE